MVSVADGMLLYILYAANDCSKILGAKYHQLLLERHASATGHDLSAVEQHNRFLRSFNSRWHTVQHSNILQILPTLPTSPKVFPIRTIVIRENLLQQALTQTHVSSLSRFKF